MYVTRKSLFYCFGFCISFRVFHRFIDPSKVREMVTETKLHTLEWNECATRREAFVVKQGLQQWRYTTKRKELSLP